VIEHCRKRELTNPVILDVGTGSGCIAIAILSQLTGATAVAADISPQALAVAKKNAVRHGLSDRITFLEADRLGLPAGAIPENGFDIIASNPPYVPTGEIETLGPNVKDYEPHEALTDGGDGLSFYETIATEAPNILGPDGIVLVEIADGQEQAVRDTFTRAKKWAHAGTWKDAVTNRERVVAFVRD
jgi:release factor glutamine methyltransferase